MIYSKIKRGKPSLQNDEKIYDTDKTPWRLKTLDEHLNEIRSSLLVVKIKLR